ncbi:MAG: 3-dehydroquinate synthase [Lachnospiraceae bacterium]|jgi:3-dehydroquinate synthase|nr:3-dehydroquinate synthase [Lachnospiraceae bacterium]
MEERKRVVLPVQRDGKPCYSIVVEESFEGLAAELAALEVSERKICIVTDSQVGPLYADLVEQELLKACKRVICYTIEAGEEHKTLDTVRRLYERLIREHFDRKDLLVALGGGVVGDLTGFTAATYLRGIRFVQLPTTLLAQVDSSIGGKTGVDFDSYKNMVGAFHMPSLVYMNLSALKTLPERQFASGMAEILKHGLIRDQAYYEWLLQNEVRIRRREYEALLFMITESCKIKRSVVEADPTEQGERALLNFGHTIGHAVEKLKDFRLLHGECVAMGIMAAGFLSVQRGLLKREELQEIERGLKVFSLPTAADGLEAGQVVETTRSDKKMEAGSIKFVLLRGIGEAFVDRTVTEEELLRASSYLLGKDIKGF